MSSQPNTSPISNEAAPGHDPDAGPVSNLFHGLLAVHLGFVRAEEFFAATTICFAQRDRFVLDVLEANKALARNDAVLILGIATTLIQRKQGDIQQALDSLGISTDLKQALRDMPLPADARESVDAIHTRDTGEPGADAIVISRTPEGKYSLLHEHARGGLGKIMLALDNDVQREVAMKLLHEKYTRHKDARRRRLAVQRFLEEAQITGQLEHPNIVPVYEIGQRPDGALYYTMKFIRGEPLSSVLDEIALNPPWTDEKRRATRYRLLNIFIDVCNAIAYAHSRGVIHRDLKPENVMVGDYGEVLVVDWGLAKVKGSPDRTAGVLADAIRTIRTMAEEAQQAKQDGLLFPDNSAKRRQPGIAERAAALAAKGHTSTGNVAAARGTPEPAVKEASMPRRPTTGASPGTARRGRSRMPFQGTPSPSAAPAVDDQPPARDPNYAETAASAHLPADGNPAVSQIAHDSHADEGTVTDPLPESVPADVSLPSQQARADDDGGSTDGSTSAWTSPGQVQPSDSVVALAGANVGPVPDPASGSSGVSPAAVGGAPGFADVVEPAEPTVVKPQQPGEGEEAVPAFSMRPPRGITEVIEAEEREREMRERFGEAASAGDAPSSTPSAPAGSAVSSGRMPAAGSRAGSGPLPPVKTRFSTPVGPGGIAQAAMRAVPGRPPANIDAVKASTRSAQMPRVEDQDAPPADEAAKDGHADTEVSHDNRNADPTGLRTLEGSIIGTPAYMPPEQAMGRIHAVDERSDIYALGAILYEMLTLVPPFDGDNAWEIISRVVTEEVEAPSMLVSPGEIPEDLEEICLRCLLRRPEDRYQTVTEVSDDIRLFLEGAKERERNVRRSHNKFKRGRRKARSYRRLRAHTMRLEERLRELEASYPGWLDSDEKTPLWSAEDDLEELRRQADHDFEMALHNYLQALTYHRDNTAARHAIGELYWVKLTEAEARGDHRAAALYLSQMARFNTDGYFKERLRGDGQLILVTTPPGSEVTARLLTRRERMLVPGQTFLLGHTPIKRPVPMGSYLLEVVQPSMETVRVPLHVARNAIVRMHIGLLDEGAIPQNFVYIPGGPYIRRGDPALGEPDREWADVGDFFCARYPVTCGEYLEYLNEVHLADAERARRVQPRGGRGPSDHFWQFDPSLQDGRGGYHWPDFFNDSDLIQWSADLPVVGVNWDDAAAYIKWRSKRDERPYRLPSADQWEKAARGVDGRYFPWGDDFDPSFCNMNETHEYGPRLMPVTMFSTDESPYGICGIAGNASEWLAELLPDRPGLAGVRGGNFTAPEEETRCARRAAAPKEETTLTRTFRLVYPANARLSHGSVAFPDARSQS